MHSAARVVHYYALRVARALAVANQDKLHGKPMRTAVLLVSTGSLLGFDLNVGI